MANEPTVTAAPSAPRILFKDKQARIILLLKNVQQPWYLSALSKACGTTYVHTSNFIKICEEMGITANEKHGKIKEIKLTEKGLKLAELLSGTYAIINQGQGQNGVQQKPEEQKPSAPQEKK